MSITPKMKHAYRAVALVMTVWLTGYAGATMAVNRVALVIGNSDYTEFDDLGSPTRDAIEIAKKLRAIGFSLVGDKAHVNVERTTMFRLLDDLEAQSSRRRTPSDSTPMTVVYFSGHGVSYENDNWLVPVDDGTIRFREDLQEGAIATASVLDHLPEHGGLNLVFMDACRDNQLKSKRTAITKGSQTPKGLVRRDTPSNVAIVYAAAEGEVAYADSGYGLSPFTKALLANIDTPGMNILRALANTAAAVVEETDGMQEPSLSETKLAGMNLDMEFFVPCTTQDTECRKIIVPDPAKRAYERAARIGTIIAYYSVIEDFPHSPYATMAQQDIDELTSDHFSKPPAGRGNVLKTAEIKWCLRQKEWLMKFRRTAQGNIQSIDTFNQLIEDYNIRCSNFRHRTEDLSVAERWINQHSRWLAATVPHW